MGSLDSACEAKRGEWKRLVNRLLRCNLLIRKIGTRRRRVKRKIQRINAHETWLLLLLLLQEKKGCMRKLAEKKENPELLGNPELKEHRDLLSPPPVLGAFPAKPSFSVFSDLLIDLSRSFTGG